MPCYNHRNTLNSITTEKEIINVFNFWNMLEKIIVLYKWYADLKASLCVVISYLSSVVVRSLVLWLTLT